MIRVVRTRLRNAFEFESVNCLWAAQRRACSAWRPVRKQKAPIIQSRLVVSLRIKNWPTAGQREAKKPASCV